jgi:hypothetical protein
VFDYVISLRWVEDK